jgi:hypothetical protein
MTKPSTGTATSLLTAGVLIAAVWPAINARVGSFGQIRVGRAPCRAALSRSQVLLRSAYRLAEARERMARRPYDGEAALHAGEFELSRASQLALYSYEGLPRRASRAMEDDRDAYVSWRERFLRTDPTSNGCLARATSAATTALTLRLAPIARCRALLVLARARGSMGDLPGQIAALQEAARGEPRDMGLWVRLAEARSQAGRWTHARKAWAQARWLAGARGLQH